MTTVTHDSPGPLQRWAGLRRAGSDLAVGLALLLAVAAATRSLVDLPTIYFLQSIALYALMGALILRHAPAALTGPGLGAANRVTLVRAALLLPVAALVVQPAIRTDAGYWWIIALCTAAMILDGVDGWMARRTGTSTAFGGRFDMELDAFLMLALSVLVWLSGKVGPWVMLIGGLRYLFVTAGWVWSPLRAELPPSQRRQTVCVIQGVVLLVCLGPIISSAMASAVAGGALVLLIYSFAMDVRWLLTADTAHHLGR